MSNGAAPRLEISAFIAIVLASSVRFAILSFRYTFERCILTVQMRSRRRAPSPRLLSARHPSVARPSRSMNFARVTATRSVLDGHGLQPSRARASVAAAASGFRERGVARRGGLRTADRSAAFARGYTRAGVIFVGLRGLEERPSDREHAALRDPEVCHSSRCP